MIDANRAVSKLVELGKFNTLKQFHIINPESKRTKGPRHIYYGAHKTKFYKVGPLPNRIGNVKSPKVEAHCNFRLESHRNFGGLKLKSALQLRFPISD